MAAAAFFDMDRTLLRVNSGVLWMRFLRRRGEISRWGYWRSMGWALRYKLTLLDVNELAGRMAQTQRGDREDALAALCDDWFQRELLGHVSRPAREAVAAHKAQGEPVVLLTTSTPYVGGPLVRALGMDDLLCTRLAVVDGCFTGGVQDVCYGDGKVRLAEAWAAERGIDLGASTFYSDSYSDLPMLARVGRPVVTNPDPRLRREARRRGWPTLNWDVP